MPSAAMVKRFRLCVDRGDAGLAEAIVLLAAQQYPDVSVEQVSTELDRLAATVPEPSREALVATLFGPGGFAGHTGDYYDPDNSFLHRVLERRLGIPISLAFVAMEVGRRIGVPLDGVGYPGHFLLRDRCDAATFIDPFGGRLLTEGECVVWFHRSHPAGASWRRDYLHPVDNVALLTRMISNLVAIFARNRDFAGISWMMQLRCSLPNATRADQVAFARLMAPLN
jgi:regulator of sirC expression with transglutaminase-like and TPR domain